MAIPEHVKQQARDVVSHRETTAMIRAFKDNGVEASPGDLFTHSKSPVPENRPIPDEVKRQAREVISNPEIKAQIQLVKNGDEVTAPITISHGTNYVAAKIARIHETGQALDKTHQKMTQDHFGMEHG